MGIEKGNQRLGAFFIRQCWQPNTSGQVVDSSNLKSPIFLIIILLFEKPQAFPSMGEAILLDSKDNRILRIPGK